MDSNEQQFSTPEQKDEYIKQLFTQIEECETARAFDRGFELAQTILKTDENNVQALLAGAGCLVSRGASEEDDVMAKEWYVKAIGLQPDTGYEKYFAYAQIMDGATAVELYTKGLSILENELSKINPSVDEYAKLNSDKIDVLRSQVEVYITDLSDKASLLKAREITLSLLKDQEEKFKPYDIFLLAQIYDKLGRKNKWEIKEICQAAARRVLCFPSHKETDEDTAAIFISKMAKFCLDYGFINIAGKLLTRLRDVGGETLEYLSLKAVYYRIKCDDAMKNAHAFASSCLEEIELMQAEAETNGENDQDEDMVEEIKETMNEIKKKTPLKLEKLFKDATEEATEDEEDSDDEYAEFTDEDDNFPLTTNIKTIHKTKKFQKIFANEEKRILELCRTDLATESSQQQNGMEVE